MKHSSIMNLFFIRMLGILFALAIPVSSSAIEIPDIHNRQNTMAAIGAAPFAGQLPQAAEDASEPTAQDEGAGSPTGLSERKSSAKMNAMGLKKNKASNKPDQMDKDNPRNITRETEEETHSDQPYNQPSSEELIRGY